MNEYNEIINGIKAKLTDDKKNNIKYLSDEAKKYVNHQYSQEITKEIGRMIFDNLSDEQKKEINKIHHSNPETFENKLDEAVKLIKEKQLTEAKKVLIDYVYEAQNYNKNDETIRYYSFNSLIEFYCAVPKLKTDKKVVWSSYKISLGYYFLCYIALEEKNFDEALTYIDKAIIFNPASVNNYFEKAECFKFQNNYEQMKEVTLKAYEWIIDEEALARYYRNLGFYYTEKEQYDIAYALFMISNIFSENETALHEIGYIKSKTANPKFSVPVDDAFKLLKENNIGIGLSEENISLLDSFVNDKKAIEKNKDLVLKVKETLYKLTNDKKYETNYQNN